jgi:hypothetical protein
MKKEEFENIVNLQNNLKEQPNSKLYNNTLKEFQSRK